MEWFNTAEKANRNAVCKFFYIHSKILAQNDSVSVTVFAFSKGEEISTHDSAEDALVHVLEGTGKFTVEGKEHIVKSGQVLVMPAKAAHSVYVLEDFK